MSKRLGLGFAIGAVFVLIFWMGLVTHWWATTTGMATYIATIVLAAAIFIGIGIAQLRKSR